MQMTFYEELLANTDLSQREVQDFLLYGAFLRCADWNRRFSQALMCCQYQKGQYK